MNTRPELKGKVKRAKDLTNEEIDKMRWEHIQPLVDFEYALLKIREDKKMSIKSVQLYQHYLDLSEGNSSIAKRFFMESDFCAYWEDVCEELGITDN